MRWINILLLAMLGGCALLPPTPAPVARPEQSESVPFAMNGRIAISHHGTHHSAGLHWTHQSASDEILLFAPLGQTAARVYRDAQHATLNDGGKRYQDVDAEALMRQVLGWYLPLNGLHLWVLGMADSGNDTQIERDDRGRILVLHQQGWVVRFLRYVDDKPGSLPTRLQLTRDDLLVQLIIDDWEWSPQ